MNMLTKDFALRRVAVTPDLLEVARKIQTGQIRKVLITGDMVGNSVHTEGSLSIVRPKVTSVQVAKSAAKVSAVIAIMSEFCGIEMSVKDVNDLMMEKHAEFGNIADETTTILEKLAKAGRVKALTRDGKAHYVLA